MALARSGAVNDRGETAACRAAATTSSLGASLGTNAEAPGLEGGEQVLVAGVHGEHDEADVRALLAQLADGVESAAVGQADVAHDDVGNHLGSHLHGLTDRRGLRGDAEVRVPVECATQALTNQVVVVNQQNGVCHEFLH